MRVWLSNKLMWRHHHSTILIPHWQRVIQSTSYHGHINWTNTQFTSCYHSISLIKHSHARRIDTIASSNLINLGRISSIKCRWRKMTNIATHENQWSSRRLGFTSLHWPHGLLFHTIVCVDMSTLSWRELSNRSLETASTGNFDRSTFYIKLQHINDWRQEP